MAGFRIHSQLQLANQLWSLAKRHLTKYFLTSTSIFRSRAAPGDRITDVQPLRQALKRCLQCITAPDLEINIQKITFLTNLDGMFDHLKKYKQTNHFFFKASDSLSKVCNAPADKSGVYLIYALKDGHVELIYIGRSGEITEDGTLFIRKAGLGGLKDRLVNGKQFGLPRRNSWKTQMIEEKIEALDIYWYVTHGDNYIDCPSVVEQKLLQTYYSIYGRLPKWNNELRAI